MLVFSLSRGEINRDPSGAEGGKKMEKVKRKILLTGAAGRIGTALTLGLKDSYELYLTDIKPREVVAVKDEIYRSDRYFQVDLANQEEVTQLFRNAPHIDVLLHFAASWHQLDNILKNMITLTAYLTEVAPDYGINKYIYASSGSTVEFYNRQAAEQGNPFHLQKSPSIIHEGATPRATNHYGLAKVWMEYHARMLSDTHGLRTIGLRMGHFTLKGDLSDLNESQKKRGLIAKDAVQLVRRSIENEHILCEVFNATSWLPGAPGAWLDTSRAQKVLGYEPSLRWEG
jgi:uronate dehydrogenase